MTTTTSIIYSIPPGALSSEVTLAVYDVTGHLVRTLVNESAAANTASLTWNGTNDKGLPVSSGTYFFQLDWNGKHVNRRVVLLR
ncbi:MAG: T9SS type A sorting domain-containing protein [Candidatus Eisenbacteria sp.]|nr:T9SS type A sorting domain-containing protein [Candidatus Eisenbacteria bacterium]